MSVEDVLNDTLTLERKTSVKDSSAGQAAPTWAAVASDVACCQWPAGYSIVKTFARRDLIVELVFATAIDIGASARDRVVFDGRHHGVIGYQPFKHPSGDTLYLTITGRRNQN